MSKVAIVTITVPVPVDATRDQIREWIEYEVGHRSEMQLSNPLEAHQINAIEVHTRITCHQDC